MDNIISTYISSQNLLHNYTYKYMQVAHTTIIIYKQKKRAIQYAIYGSIHTI